MSSSTQGSLQKVQVGSSAPTAHLTPRPALRLLSSLQGPNTGGYFLRTPPQFPHSLASPARCTSWPSARSRPEAASPCSRSCEDNLSALWPAAAPPASVSPLPIPAPHPSSRLGTAFAFLSLHNVSSICIYWCVHTEGSQQIRHKWYFFAFLQSILYINQNDLSDDKVRS